MENKELEKNMSKLLYGIRHRCKNPKYKTYFGKGIKCFLSVDDLIYLWKRDKADKLEKPELDRENVNGNYEAFNCRFIEKSYNSSRVGSSTFDEFDLVVPEIKFCSYGSAAKYFSVSPGTIKYWLKNGNNNIKLVKKIHKKQILIAIDI